MDYARKYFVDDLYSSTNILGKFNNIEFENVYVFLKSVQNNYIVFSKTYRNLFININSKDELDLFLEFMCLDGVDKLSKFFIQMKYKEKSIDILFEKILNKNWILLVDYNEEMSEYYQELDKKYNLVIKCDIDINNYVRIFNNIPYLVLKYKLNNYYFNIDYFSFEELKLSEIHKLVFFINNLTYWFNMLNYNKGNTVLLDCYVSSEYKIYPGKQAYNDNYCIFDLYKYADIKGGSIPHKDLNILLAYIDIPLSIVFKDIDSNNRLINLYQNYKISNSYINISDITKKFIGRIK